MLREFINLSILSNDNLKKKTTYTLPSVCWPLLHDLDIPTYCEDLSHRLCYIADPEARKSNHMLRCDELFDLFA